MRNAPHKIHTCKANSTLLMSVLFDDSFVRGICGVCCPQARCFSKASFPHRPLFQQKVRPRDSKDQVPGRRSNSTVHPRALQRSSEFLTERCLRRCAFPRFTQAKDVRDLWSPVPGPSLDVGRHGPGVVPGILDARIATRLPGFCLVTTVCLSMFFLVFI